MELFLSFTDNVAGHLNELKDNQMFMFEQDELELRFWRPDQPDTDGQQYIRGTLDRHYFGSDFGIAFELMLNPIPANTPIRLTIILKKDMGLFHQSARSILGTVYRDRQKGLWLKMAELIASKIEEDSGANRSQGKDVPSSRPSGITITMPDLSNQ